MDEVNFGMNQYCGPAVLSIFTGLDTDTCAEAVTKVNGKHRVTGVTPPDLIKAGELLGIEIIENPAFQGRSLFWTASALVRFNGMFLVTIPKHYIAIEVRDGSIQICDNHTKEPIDLGNSARLSQKVEKVYTVRKVREYVKPTIVSSEIHVEEVFGTVDIKRIIQYSDGEVKIRIIGSLNTVDGETLQTIAFKLMEIAGAKA